MKYETITLYNNKGKAVEEFASKDEAFEKLGYYFIAEEVGLYLESQIKTNYPVSNVLKEFYRREVRTKVTTHAKFLLKNDYGECLTLGNFQEQIKKRKKSFLVHHRSWRLENWNGVGPVPGIHKSKNYNYFRHPKTLQALKACYVCKEDGEPPIRGRRRAKQIPTAYSDIGRSDIGNNNWKRYRKTQYK